MKRSTIVILCSFLLALFVLLSNYKDVTKNPQNVSEMDYDYHFVFIGQDSQNPLWESIRDGVEDAAKKYNVAVEYYFSDEGNQEDEIEYLKMSVSARVDGIVINGYEDEEIKEITIKAYELGIPIIFINDESNMGVRTAYIGVNNLEAGKRVVRVLNLHREGNLKIGILLDAQKNSQESIRFQSMLEEIERNAYMEFVTEDSPKDARADVYNSVKSMLIDNPEINALIGTRSYHGGVIGEVLVDLDMVGDVLVVGFDDLDDTLRYIEKGVISATLNIDTYNIGYYSIQNLVKYKENKLIDEVYYMPVKIIDKKNIQEYLQVKRYE